MPGKAFLLAAVLLAFLYPAAPLPAETGPDLVEIDVMTDLFEMVAFDHAMHLSLVDDNCAVCHHHTTGMAPVEKRCLKCHQGGVEADSIACGDCHSTRRFEADYLAALAADPTIFHTDKPGLKAAYHRNCLGCHQKEGGPTGCEDCHARNKNGDAFFHAGDYSPKPADKSRGH